VSAIWFWFSKALVEIGLYLFFVGMFLVVMFLIHWNSERKTKP
jgi:hypothetical protein